MLKSLAAALALTFATSSALADDAPSAENPPMGPPAAKRKLPDYDGRGPRPTPPENAFLWVWRIIFSPIYFTTEYLLRRPMGAFLPWAERANAFQSLYDFFAFGPDH